MTKKLYVGNLPYETTEDQLRELFSQAGQVESVNIIINKFSGRSKGFAFVEMSSEEEAQKAIKMFNEYQLGGRAIIVNEARPREERKQHSSGLGGQQDFNQDQRNNS